MDNRVFDVNGKGSEQLAAALLLAFVQAGKMLCHGWQFSVDHGLILFAYSVPDSGSKLPCPLGPEAMLPIVQSWLLSEEAKTVKLGRWHCDLSHDGHNTIGWRVYVEDWGKVGIFDPICAVSPSYMWHGK